MLNHKYDLWHGTKFESQNARKSSIFEIYGRRINLKRKAFDKKFSNGSLGDVLWIECNVV